MKLYHKYILLIICISSVYFIALFKPLLEIQKERKEQEKREPEIPYIISQQGDTLYQHADTALCISIVYRRYKP